MNYRIIACIFFWFFGMGIAGEEHINKPASWTILVYIETTHGLQEWSFQNIHDMTLLNADNNVHLLVWLHAHGDEAWLYKVGNRSLKEEATMVVLPDVAQNIVNAMQIAASCYPADKYGLVLWDHGYGILTPYKDEETGEWDVAPDCVEEEDAPDLVECLCRPRYKGMLIDAAHDTCLDHAGMIYACSAIYDILGKKLAFLGMDLCMGAMIEHAYQLAPYVEFMLGSQECEMPDGWDYAALVRRLSSVPEIGARELVASIINDYNDYYEPRSPEGLYTHSALDLSYALTFKEHAKRLVYLMKAVRDADAQFLGYVRNARKESFSMAWKPMYIDLHDFYDHLLNYLKTYTLDATHEHLLEDLQEELKLGCNLIDNMVVARTGGFAVERTHGPSIYFPQHRIDNSYRTVLFALHSSWLSFLEMIIEC